MADFFYTKFNNILLNNGGTNNYERRTITGGIQHNARTEGNH